MVAIFATPSPERIKLMDFTTAIAIDQYAMLQPMPTVLNQYTAPIKPFQPMVWTSQCHNEHNLLLSSYCCRPGCYFLLRQWSYQFSSASLLDSATGIRQKFKSSVINLFTPFKLSLLMVNYYYITTFYKFLF